MSKHRLRPLQDRGAVLVHVGIALLLLLGFSAIVLDYGILWISRAQAQNAADAGALAGAVSLAFESTDRSDTGPAKTKAVATANQNYVWGQPAGVTVADVSFPLEPAAFCRAPDGTSLCVRVNVYRNVAHNNPLPVFFARLFGIANQGVQAMAIAQAAFGDRVECMRPWAIPDKWQEVTSPPYSYLSTFDLYDSKGNPLPNPDVYDGPEMSGGILNLSYTGYRVPQPLGPWAPPGDYGQEVRLKMGSPADAVTPGWFQPIDIPIAGPDTGGDRYRENIEACNPTANYTLGDPLTVEPGNMIGPTKQGVNALVAQDPNWLWDPTCTDASMCPCKQCSPHGGMRCSGGSCQDPSPRIVPIPVYNPTDYIRSGRTEINIINVLGFFVVGMDGNDVLGHFVGITGIVSGNGTSGSSWIRVIRLVR